LEEIMRGNDSLSNKVAKEQLRDEKAKRKLANKKHKLEQAATRKRSWTASRSTASTFWQRLRQRQQRDQPTQLRHQQHRVAGLPPSPSNSSRALLQPASP